MLPAHCLPQLLHLAAALPWWWRCCCCHCCCCVASALPAAAAASSSRTDVVLLLLLLLCCQPIAYCCCDGGRCGTVNHVPRLPLCNCFAYAAVATQPTFVMLHSPMLHLGHFCTSSCCCGCDAAVAAILPLLCSSSVHLSPPFVSGNCALKTRRAQTLGGRWSLG